MGRTKIILVGNSGVGKTTLLARYLDSCVVDYAHERRDGVVTVEYQLRGFKLQIRDQIVHSNPSSAHTLLRGTNAAAIVFDLTERPSFESVRDWRRRVQRPSLLCLMLVGNKSDRTKRRVVSFEEAKALAEELGMFYIETSAKNLANLRCCFETLARVSFAASFEKWKKRREIPN
mmetsp:Transcript_18076/g.32366  ORF Transcript_18076/g.32366 Transcript_18076/m.32366 type:complete len:175 (+) Transcript_18076:25-549(+)